MRNFAKFLILFIIFLTMAHCSGQGSTVVGNPPPTSVSNPKKLTFTPIKDGTSIAQIPLDFFGRAGRDVEISSVQVVINGLLANLFEDLSSYVQIGRKIVRLEINNLEDKDLVAIIIIQNGAPKDSFEAILSEDSFSEAELKEEIDIIGFIGEIDDVGENIFPDQVGISENGEPIIRNLFPGLFTELVTEVRNDLANDILFFSDITIFQDSYSIISFSPIYHEEFTSGNILYAPIPDNKCRINSNHYSFGDFYQYRYSPINEISIPDENLTAVFSARVNNQIPEDGIPQLIDLYGENTFFHEGFESYSFTFPNADFSLRRIEDQFNQRLAEVNQEALRFAVNAQPGNNISVPSIEDEINQYDIGLEIDQLAGEVDLLGGVVSEISYPETQFNNFVNFPAANIIDRPLRSVDFSNLRWETNSLHDYRLISVYLYSDLSHRDYIVCHLKEDYGDLAQMLNLPVLEAYYDYLGENNTLNYIEIVYHHDPIIQDFAYTENGVQKTKKAVFLQKTVTFSGVDDEVLIENDINPIQERALRRRIVE